jgi:DNA ligase-1
MKTTLPELMHGCDFWPTGDLSGWWISQKLDGWRCFWDGTGLFTRQGNRYAAPAWFTKDLPATPLDCELVTAGQTSCDRVNSAVRAGQWHRLELRPFDLAVAGMAFEQAQATIAKLALPEHVRPVAWRQVQSTAEAVAAMRAIVAAGGEGAMCRNPAACYRPGRTGELVKIKPAMLAENQTRP